MSSHEMHAWIRRVTDGAPDAKVARRAGLAQATYAKQRRNSKITPETVVSIARTYGASPLEGLIALGLLGLEDVREVRSLVHLKTATDDELLSEMERRIKGATAGVILASGDEF